MIDYEKKYKEALEWMKSLYNGLHGATKEEAEKYFPELKESKDERIRKRLIDFFEDWGETKSHCWGINVNNILTWLEKQGEQPSEIRWYDVSLIPQEMEELLVEWDSEDATWHEIAFYHADTKTFWNGTRQVENVTRWCYIIDLLEKQGEHDETSTAIKNPEAYRIGFADGEAHAKEEMNTWSDEDEENLQHCCGAVFAADYYTYEDKQDMEKWLLQLKERLS